MPAGGGSSSRCSRFSLSQIAERLRKALAARAGAGTLSDDCRADLWKALRELIVVTVRAPVRHGVLPAGELDELQELEQTLAPSDPAQRYEWLFARNSRIWATVSRFGDPAYDGRLAGAAHRGGR